MTEAVVITIIVCVTSIILSLLFGSQILQFKKYEVSSKALENADKIKAVVEDLDKNK